MQRQLSIQLPLQIYHPNSSKDRLVLKGELYYILIITFGYFALIIHFQEALYLNLIQTHYLFLSI
ncbi:hypothetical protein SAMN04488122_5771 [Chitinophaga arvensicola]|uniref:Uncharacterized protein n=1 Tax=Chitinophaga arvensicola TaxID=29529 RepID=A0A1I0SBA0_9BACT|nr:hypothetical protein SAMN04488122_5771 [Chitinophaga arvensicola]